MSKRNFKLGKDENDKGRFRVCLSLYVHHMIFSHLLHLMSIFIVTASMSLYFTELKCSCASEGGEREASQPYKTCISLYHNMNDRHMIISLKYHLHHFFELFYSYPHILS